jgi:hypothetical protein
MSQYFAQLNVDNVVIDVAVVTADFMAENPDRYPGRWVETFFDTAGKTYAGVGFIYDEDSDDFVAPVSSEPITPLAE